MSTNLELLDKMQEESPTYDGVGNALLPGAWYCANSDAPDIKSPVFDDLLQNLERIGEIKNSLPMEYRWWCHRLGLYVRLRAGKVKSLRAGNKRIWCLDALKQPSSEDWSVRKYTRGAWERLVEPTLAASEWIISHQVTKDSVAEFDEALYWFEKTGTLSLP